LDFPTQESRQFLGRIFPADGVEHLDCSAMNPIPRLQRAIGIGLHIRALRPQLCKRGGRILQIIDMRFPARVYFARGDALPYPLEIPRGTRKSCTEISYPFVIMSKQAIGDCRSFGRPHPLCRPPGHMPD
jgi:hypothetical protein